MSRCRLMSLARVRIRTITSFDDDDDDKLKSSRRPMTTEDEVAEGTRHSSESRETWRDN